LGGKKLLKERIQNTGPYLKKKADDAVWFSAKSGNKKGDPILGLRSPTFLILLVSFKTS
jgi:hypothetical protein